MPFITATIMAIGAFIAQAGTFIAALQATQIGAFIVKTLAYVATNLLVQAIMGSPKPPAFSLKTKITFGDDVSRSFILGQTMTAGSLVYANTYQGTSNTPNAWLTYVIALSDLPVKGLDGVWVNSELVTLGAVDPDKGYYIDEYAGNLYIKFYDGTQTAADSYLVSQFSSAAKPWGSDRIGYGVAYAIIHAKINQEYFSGFPEFRFLVDGVKLYDPSKDTTAGGSGTQRWDTPSTWGGDGDYLPMVQAYNVMRGISYNGAWFYGLQGVSAARLPNATWIAEIEKCRATVTENDGPQPRYRAAVEVEVAGEIGNCLEGLLTACAGRMSEAGGIFKPLAGAVGSSVKSFTDDDILATADQSFTPFPGLANTVNGVVISYPDPLEAYNLKTSPPIYDATFEQEDGGYRLLSQVTLPMCPYAEQVQRLAKWALSEARQHRRHTLVMPPEWHVIEPNDCVTWSSARNGYSNKLFRIDGVAILASGDVVIEVTETDPTAYSWNTATDFTVVNTSPVAIVRPPSQSVIGLNVAAVAIVDGASTTKRVGLQFTWSTTGIDDVFGIKFEVRLQSTQAIVSRPETLNFESGAIVTEEGLVANTTYEVRAQYIANDARTVGWTSWVPVTTTLTIAAPSTPVLVESLYATRDGTAVRVLLSISWTGNLEAAEYQVEARLAIDADGNNTGDSFVTYGRTDLTAFEIRDVAPGTWEVRVKAITSQGISSGYATEALEVAGLGAAPSALTNVSLQTAGGLAVLKWDVSPDLDVRIGGRIMIRHSNSTTPSWANSVSFDEVDGNNTIGVVPLKPGAYLVRPKDASGVLGPVTTVSTKGATAVTFTNSTTLTADPTWAGTKTNVSITGGNELEIDGVGELFTFTQALDNAAWTKILSSVTANVDTPPGGGSAYADKIVEDTTASAAHYIFQSRAVVAGRTYALKGVFKAAGRDCVRLNVLDGQFGANSHAIFDLVAGTATTPGTGEVKITDLGSGWFLCEWYPVCTTSGTTDARIQPQPTVGSNGVYTGDGTSGIIATDVSFYAVEASGVYEFATTMDLTSVKNVRLRSDIDVSAVSLTSTISDVTDLIDSWPDFDGTDGADIDVIVEARVTDDDPAGSPVWSAWTRLDATEDEFRAAQFRATLYAYGSDFNILLAGLSVYADEVL